MWACWRSTRTTLKKLWQTDHPIVRSRSLALPSICGTVLVAIGCYQLVRSIEAVLHLPDTQRVSSSSLGGTTMCVEAHSSRWDPLPCAPPLMCSSREPRLASRPCRSSWRHKPYVLELAHLSWHAACGDHCHEVVAGQPSDGPVVITGPNGHV